MLSCLVLCKKILHISYFKTVICVFVFKLLHVFSTAEAVLQEMDNINIRRNRRSGEVERLRMWTDTEFVSADYLSS